MTQMSFVEAERLRATEWKKSTPTLPNAARQEAPWVNQEGVDVGRYSHCLPRKYASFNLLPGIRDGAVALFAELGIPWHCGVAGGPGNNLLSSQVQCVNALYPMVTEPARIIGAFGSVLDIAEVLQIEPDRYLTFEYIGPENYFGEGSGGPRVRGSGCTSVDAAFIYRTTSKETELALVEWKYTESYASARRPEPEKDAIRARRYLSDFEDPDGTLRSELIPFAAMLDEPFYQLMRQQLLAHRLELAQAHSAARVRVVHVLSPGNLAYQHSMARAEHRGMAATVGDAWQALLRQPDRFHHLDLEVFLDQDITSREYLNRYGPHREIGELVSESWERLRAAWCERVSSMSWNDLVCARVKHEDGRARGMPWLSIEHDAGGLLALCSNNGWHDPARFQLTPEDEKLLVGLGWRPNDEGGYRYVTHRGDYDLVEMCLDTLASAYKVEDPQQLSIEYVLGEQS